MVVFKLTMPSSPSWNGRWSGEGRLYCKCIPDRKVPKHLIGNRYLYRWDDGWCAAVEVEKVTCREAEKLERKSSGFCGYDWMIYSLIKHGYIISPSEEKSND